MGESRLILGPIAGKEYEAIEHHAGSYDRYVLEGLLEDDVEMSMHAIGIGDPPKVQPIGIQLYGEGQQ